MDNQVYTTKIPETASLPTLLSYSFGFAPSAVLCYNAFYIYFMYFMTDVAKISAVAAGLIALGAISWDAISNPIFAYVSDNCRWKAGRRIPFMTIGIFVMTIAFTGVFTLFDVSPAWRAIWFIFATIIYWTGSSMYDIPHNALGSELVSRQSEREKLRLGTMLVDGVGLLFIVLVIPTLTAALTESTGSAAKAWQLTMMLIAVIACMIGVTACVVLKNKAPKINWEVYDRLHANEKKESYFGMLREIFQLKPFKRLVILVVLLNAGSVCMQSTTVYFLTYTCGYDPAQQTLVFGVLYGTNLLWGIIIAVFLQNKLGSSKVFIFGISLAAFALLFFPNVLDVRRIGVMCTYAFFLAVGSRVLWLYCYIYAYRCAMLDDIKNNKHREGNLVGFMSLGLKLGSAIATFSIGGILQLFGYNGAAAEQTASAFFGIRFVATMLPAILFIIGLLILIRYPMGEKDVKAIEGAIKNRNAGKPYSTEEFEHLL